MNSNPVSPPTLLSVLSLASTAPTSHLDLLSNSKHETDHAERDKVKKQDRHSHHAAQISSLKSTHKGAQNRTDETPFAECLKRKEGGTNQRSEDRINEGRTSKNGDLDSVNTKEDSLQSVLAELSRVRKAVDSLRLSEGYKVLSAKGEGATSEKIPFEASRGGNQEALPSPTDPFHPKRAERDATYGGISFGGSRSGGTTPDGEIGTAPPP